MWLKLKPKIEARFKLLVAEANKNNFNINAIIEQPTTTGETCFRIASDFSHSISQYILNRDIDVNFISTTFMTPWFSYGELTKQMLLKGINPFIIYNGRNQLERYPFHFKNEQELLNKFKRSGFFFVEDTKCNANCPEECQSKFNKFKCYPGSLVLMSTEYKIGSGAFGNVYEGNWHGINSAMKCVPIKDAIWRENIGSIKKEFENIASEYRTQLSTAGEGVILPTGMFRQQNQYFDRQKNRWTEINHHVMIYPKYDCDLFELHEKSFADFNEDILGNIMHQCLLRD